ncbi:MAG: NAD(P)/FAD-dependent oxidoreductase, partial [Pirellulales bacterium]
CWSVRLFHQWRERLELKESRCGFSPVGVVWIPSTKAEDHAQALHHFQDVGVPGGLVPAEEIRQRYPALNLCPHALDLTGEEHACQDAPSLFFEPDGGYADPQGTTEDLMRAAADQGVELFVRHQVTGIESAGGTHTVRCGNGATFSGGLLLNACGPWFQSLNAMVGVTLPMNLAPVRVQIATRDRPADVVGALPVFVSAADQLYARPEANGRQLMAGSTAPEDEREAIRDPDHFEPSASPETRQRMMHKLHHRLAMQSRGSVRGYAALYTVNRDDWHPVIDALGPEGYFVANGFSGHGFKLAPSVGALIGRMMSGVSLPDDPQVDVSYFAANRRPIVSSGGVLA